MSVSCTARRPRHASSHARDILAVLPRKPCLALLVETSSPKTLPLSSQSIVSETAGSDSKNREADDGS